jgi:hypothetical protein
MSNGGALRSILTVLDAIVEAIGKTLFHWRQLIELWTVIPAIEGLMRLWFHLDPRVYSERLRIKRISEGALEWNSNKYVIFVLYAEAPLPNFTVNLLDAIERSPLNLVIVSNTELDVYFRAQLLDKCHLLIERANLGRDFGAYKDGVSVILRRAKDIERLILLNDSMFFFQRGLGKLISDLDGTQEFIGLTEVFDIHYHVQSFMLSFGPTVIKSKQFRKYWRSYRPISTRRWTIHKGEVGLSRRLTKAGFRPHILYQAAQLIPHLRTRPIREVLESVRFLPILYRQSLYREFERIIGGDSASVAEFEAISQGVRTVSPGGVPGRTETLPGITSQLQTMDRWSFDIFANKLIAAIARRNQVHVGGFIFMKYLGLPVIKRDIFYRELYSLEEIYRILGDFNEPLRDEIMSDLRRGGTGMNMKGILKMLYRHGSI